MILHRGAVHRGRRNIQGIDVVVPQGEALPAFDYWVQLLSIPGLLGNEVDTLPDLVPYLGADPATPIDAGTA